MRYLSLLAVVGFCAVAGCHDTIPSAPGPDTSLALHFDSLSAQANAASQPNRVAALNLALRALADGTIPDLLILTTGPGGSDTATYNTVSWSAASVLTRATSDSLTDSLIVFVGWRGANADTMVVVRAGDPSLAPQVRSELGTLGLLAHLASSDTTDTVTSGAFVTGNTVTVADSGTVQGDFGVLGSACTFVTVRSITNDANPSTTCNRELLLWTFALQLSPSLTRGLAQNYSSGVVVVH